MENSNELIGLGRSMREGQREVIPIRDYVVEPMKPVQHPFAGERVSQLYISCKSLRMYPGRLELSYALMKKIYFEKLWMASASVSET